MKYRLCYVKGNKAWFTDNMEKQWGDDWNDKPYEHNAGEPYDDWGELLEDNEDIFKRKYEYHKIKHKVLYFETNDWREQQPCDGYLNSPYSVEDINNKIVPWIKGEGYEIYAGTEYEEFIKVIEDNGGTVYVSRKEL